MKRGYRLTKEENAILEGEKPDGPVDGSTGIDRNETENDGSEKQGDGNNAGNGKKPGTGRTLKAILPLLIALLLMIGIANLFIWLINTPERRAREAAGNTPEKITPAPVSDKQKAAFAEKLSLDREESEAFWTIYTRFRNEMHEIRDEQNQWQQQEASGSTSGSSFSESKESYLSGYEKLNKTRNRYIEAFAALLGEERALDVMLLYEQWDDGNRPPTP